MTPRRLVPAPPAPVSPVTDARDLFPASDLELTYQFADKAQSHEFFIPDGDRLVQTFNGEPYITWFFTPDGVRTGVVRAVVDYDDATESSEKRLAGQAAAQIPPSDRQAWAGV